MLIWLKDATSYSSENVNEVTALIDEFISCSENHNQINKQKHHHSFTCRRTNKNGNEICRFGIPFFPMPETKILNPYPTNTNKKSFENDDTKLQIT